MFHLSLIHIFSFSVSTAFADDLLVAPTALAKAVLTENEMRSGCALVDFGADTTTCLLYTSSHTWKTVKWKSTNR